MIDCEIMVGVPLERKWVIYAAVWPIWKSKRQTSTFRGPTKVIFRGENHSTRKRD